MPAAARNPGTDRLLAAAPGRILYLTRDAAAGGLVVHKLLLQGSLADAEREVRLGAMVADLDVVASTSAATDPHSGRPVLTAPFVEGVDLERLVATEGAQASARACALLAPVARTLAAMHARTSAAAPFGLCHGDVKPANLLRTATTTLLIDFEHARPRPAPGAPPAAGFTGGTHGFAPPEAVHGAQPDAAFDVYGLGETLRWLIEGQPRCGGTLPPPLRHLIAECTDEAPERRPGAAAVAARLETLAAALAGELVETALAALQRGEPVAASAEPRLDRLRARQARVLRIAPDLLAPCPPPPDEPAALHAALRRAVFGLRAFPRHPTLLAARRQFLASLATLVHGAAERIQAPVRREEFAVAERWLADLAAAHRLASRQPGGLPASNTDPHHLGPSHRDPEVFLVSLAGRVAAAQEELEAVGREITRAERGLDLAAAERAIGRLAAERGGASPTATRRRDQLHRLAFYVDRIARAHSNAERLGQFWDAPALQPLLACTERCLAASRDEPAAGRGDGGAPIGLRSLLVTLTNLVEEFPHLAEFAVPAREALDAALRHATVEAWSLLADSHRKLESEPVPVRPLQTIVSRLDMLRILEAFVDLPGKARGDLLDAIERLRVAIEEARSTRDRLARSAERAIARGHWTTGLFDMERAVAQLASGDGDRGEIDRLQDRLAEARRRKGEIEAAVRRNVELAARYATLQDDHASDFESRVATLGERRDGLHFLMLHVPAERSALYGRDLREVEIQLALEHAAQAERDFDRAEGPAARLQLATATLQQLAGALRELTGEQDPPGRLVRLREHWQNLATQCEAEATRQQEAARRAARQRRWFWWTCGAAAALSIAAVLLDLVPLPWRGEPAQAASRDDREAAFARVAADPAGTLALLRERASAPEAAALRAFFDTLLRDRSADALRLAAEQLRASTDATTAASGWGEPVTAAITAALCLAVQDAEAPQTAAALALVDAAVACGLWRGLDRDELLRRCLAR